MSEISKFQEYTKKLQGICDENNLVYRFIKDGYPVRLIIAPSSGVSEQLSLLAEEHGHMSPDAKLMFSYLNGEISYRTTNDFTISEALFNKLKNLFKNMSLYWHMFFFRELVSRGITKGDMPVIDEGTEGGGDDLPPEAEPLEEDEEEPLNEEDPQNTDSELMDLADRAAEVVRMENKATLQLLQRRLNVGYATAQAVMEELEARGVVGPYNGGQPREVLPVDEPED